MKKSKSKKWVLHQKRPFGTRHSGNVLRNLQTCFWTSLNQHLAAESASTNLGEICPLWHHIYDRCCQIFWSQLSAMTKTERKVSSPKWLSLQNELSGAANALHTCAPSDWLKFSVTSQSFSDATGVTQTWRARSPLLASRHGNMTPCQCRRVRTSVEINEC